MSPSTFGPPSGTRGIAAVVVGRLRLTDFAGRIVATVTQRAGQTDQKDVHHCGAYRVSDRLPEGL